MIPVIVPDFGEEERDAVNHIFKYNGYLNEHSGVRTFEEMFAEHVGAKYCVMCTSGSMALYLALNGIKSVFPSNYPSKVPTYMGIFVAHAMKQMDVFPEIVDIDASGLAPPSPITFYIHANGRVKKDPTIFLEDCCQAVDHHTKDAISSYSFASTKHLTTFGQGGAVCCDDRDVYERLVGFKDHSRTERARLEPVKDVYTGLGTNMKMTEAQALFGIEQLKKLPKKMRRFKEIYKIYHEELDKQVKFFDTDPTWLVDIRVKKSDKLIQYLKERKIMSQKVHKPIHMQPEFTGLGLKLPKSEKLYSETVFLPSTTNLKDDDVTYICRTIKEGLKEI